MPQTKLDRVQVATPCPTSWEQMRGDDHTRFCELCNLNVYNISGMTRPAAEALLAAHTGQRLCVRLYRRADGTVLTQDCPVGLRGLRRRAARRAGVVLTAILGLFGSALGQEKKSDEKKPAAPQCQTNPPQEKLERTINKANKDAPAILSGTLLDPNGAIIPGFRIELTSTDGKEKRHTTSDANGEFAFTDLPANTYTLEVTAASGFKGLKLLDLRIELGELLKTEIKLFPAEETVIVGIIDDSYYRRPISIDSGTTIIRGEIIRKIPIP